MDDDSARQYAIYILRVVARSHRLTIVGWPNMGADRRCECELEAWSEESGERWRVQAPSLYEAAEALAEQVGVGIG